MRYPDRVVMVFDHHFSPPTEERARVLEENRAFARRHGIHLFDCGSGNIHHVGVRNGFVRPGTVVVGSDSHTPVHGTLGCFAAGLGNNSHAGMVMPFGKAWFRVPETTRIELTGQHEKAVTPRDAALWLTGQIGEGGAVYRALHFAGPYIEELEVWDRWLFPLITIDVGGKCGFIDPDDKTHAVRLRSSPAEPFDACARTRPRRPARRWTLRHQRAGAAGGGLAHARQRAPGRRACRPGGAVGRAGRTRRRADRGHPAGGRDPARPANRRRA